MKKFLTCLLLLSAQLFSQNSFIADSLDACIERGLKQWQLPGMAVAVVREGKVVRMQGYGVRESGRPDRVDVNTLFLIGSCTKAFTATSMCILESEKRLSLDDKVVRWIPDFKLYDPLVTQEVTLRDILCHRVGFRTFQGDFVNWNSDLTRQEIIHNLRNYKPAYGFRTQYGYFNAGFVTAGHVISLACDTTWDDFLKYRLFDPLQMTRTVTTRAALMKDANASVSHTVVNGKLVKIPYPNIDAMAPCGSIASSVKDMANWLLMQLDSGRFNGHNVVSFQNLQKTRTSQTIVGDYNGKLFQGRKHFGTYGLGWFLEDYAGRKIVAHDGGVDGFLTYTCLIPELNCGYVIVTNSDQQDFFLALAYQIRDALMGLPYKNYNDFFYARYQADENEIADTLAVREKIMAGRPKPSLPLGLYAGKYTNAVYGAIEIKLEKDKLNIYFQHHPHTVGRLEPLGGDTFWCTYSDPEFGAKDIPFTVENGRVKSVTIKVNDFIDYLPYEFEKLP